MKNNLFLFIVFLLIIIVYIWIFTNPTLYIEFLRIIQDFNK